MDESVTASIVVFEEAIFWIGYIVICLMFFAFSLFFFLAIYVGACRLRRGALKRGQTAHLSYLASWIVLFPLMLVVCLVHGGATLYQNRD